MALPAGRLKRIALMMQLWLSSSEIRTVSEVTRGVIVETTVAYADEKIIAASREWKSASFASSATWAPYVPEMKRTAPGPAPKLRVASSSAAITSGRRPMPR